MDFSVLILSAGALALFVLYTKVMDSTKTIKLNGISKSSFDTTNGGIGASARGKLSDKEVEAEILRLTGMNQQIEAIKFLREQRGLGLKEAKDMVNNFSATGSLRAPMVQSSNSNGFMELSGSASEDIKILLRQGKKIEALKAYRAKTGLGLSEAVREIEKLEKSMK